MTLTAVDSSSPNCAGDGGDDAAALLADYVANGSEESFRAIVERYVGLVRAAARRQVREAQLAEDVTQAVFILLARKARSISEPGLLVGWLVRAAHFCSRDALKAERRRRRHERKAAEMNAAAIEAISEHVARLEPGDESESRLWAALDAALSRLRETDRAVVALRFFEGRSMAEVAGAVGISEAAAAKRVERALGKLRRMLTRRGAAVPAMGLGAALTAETAKVSAVAAPLPSSAAVSAAALAAAKGSVIPAALGSARSWSIAKGAAHMMTMAKVKTAAVVVAAAMVAAGGSGAAVRYVWRGGGSTMQSAPVQGQPAPTRGATPAEVDGAPAVKPAPPQQQPPTLAPKPKELQIAGRVGGVVRLAGTPPRMPNVDMSAVPQCHGQYAQQDVKQETVVVGDDGGLANVVVSIKRDEGQDLPGGPSREPVVLDQRGCQYAPHVVAVMVGQPLVVKNSDPFLHNVHTLPEKNEGENRAQPNLDPGSKLKTPREAEYFRVKCDVHPWMNAWVAVIDNPYFAVTDKDGRFALPKGLADGEYRVTAWHEKYGTREGTVTVKDGGGTVEFVYQAR